MGLDKLHRKVFADPESDYEKQTLQAWGDVNKSLSLEHLYTFTQDIEEFLTDYADTCHIAYRECDRCVYELVWKTRLPKPFKKVRVLFIVEEDDDGEYILLTDFKASW